VSQLSEEYDIHTIAAAALQMAYDQTVPAWQRSDHHVQTDDASPKPSGSSKPSLAPKKRNPRSAQNQPVESPGN
jgi:ATP-dependent RNA helicase DeaD